MLVEIKITENDAGQRVDRYLRKRLPYLGLDRLHSLFRRKEIKLNGKPVPRSFQLQCGDVLKVFGLKQEETSLPEKKPVSIQSKLPPTLFEDNSLLVVDKPSGMAVHPGSGVEPGASLIEIVWAYLGGEKAKWGSVFRPALLHRLDKETSGVVLIAKNAQALREYGKAFREHDLEKNYLALVEGVPPAKSGELKNRLYRVGAKSGAKVIASSHSGKEAVSHYKVQKILGRFCLLEVKIKTGRMHQIRTQLSHAGYAIAGDDRYGDFQLNKELKKTCGLRRMFLHAESLRVHASGLELKKFYSPLPTELKHCLEKLDSLKANAEG